MGTAQSPGLIRARIDSGLSIRNVYGPIQGLQVNYRPPFHSCPGKQEHVEVVARLASRDRIYSAINEVQHL